MAKFCNQCGAKLEDGALFCAGCGATFEGPPQQNAPPPEQQFVPPPPEQQFVPPPPLEQPYAPPPPPPQQYSAEPTPQYAAPPPPPPGQQGYAPPPPPQYGAPRPAYAGAYAAPQKKKLPTWLLIVIIAAAAVAAIIIIANVAVGNEAEKDYFTLGPDQVPSMKLVLGETRDITSFKSSTSGGVQTVTVVYKLDAERDYETYEDKDVFRYAQALILDYGYINTTDYNFKGDTGSGFIFANESVEDGYILMVQIDFDTKGYTLTITRGTGTLTRNEAEPEPVEEEEAIVIEDLDDDPEPLPPPAEGMVELFIPSWYYAETPKNEVIDEAAIHGFTATANGDGSYIFTGTKEMQQKALEKSAQSLPEYYTILVSGGYFSWLHDIYWNEDFSELTLYVDIAEHKSNPELAINFLAGIGATSAFYQLLQGKGDDAKVMIYLFDDNGEYDTNILFPDAFIT